MTLFPRLRLFNVAEGRTTYSRGEATNMKKKRREASTRVVIYFSL